MRTTTRQTKASKERTGKSSTFFSLVRPSRHPASVPFSIPDPASFLAQDAYRSPVGVSRRFPPVLAPAAPPSTSQPTDKDDLPARSYLFAIGTMFAFLDAYNIGANDVCPNSATAKPEKPTDVFLATLLPLTGCQLVRDFGFFQVAVA